MFFPTSPQAWRLTFKYPLAQRFPLLLPKVATRRQHFFMLQTLEVCFLFFFFPLANFNFLLGFPGGLESNESACNAGDPSSIPGSGRSLGEGNGSLLQHSCLENPTYRGAWQNTVHGVEKSRTWLFHFLSPHPRVLPKMQINFVSFRVENTLRTKVTLNVGIPSSFSSFPRIWIFL